MIRRRRKIKEIVLQEGNRPVKLTASEQKLVEFLRKPETALLTVEKICEHIGIDPSTYYRAFKRPDFVKVVHQECVGLVHSSLLPTLHTVRMKAIEGSSHHWSRLLLEMAGLYTPNKESKAPTEINFIVNMDRPKFKDGEVIIINPESSIPEIVSHNIISR